MKKVKVGMIGLFDMLKFKNLKRDRMRMIENSSSARLESEYDINALSRHYHPEVQNLVIKEIIDEAEGVKSFILAPDRQNGTIELAPFKAGSYINLRMRIGSSAASRVYSLSSSPRDVLEGKYMVTVKKKDGGFFSTYLFEHAAAGMRLSSSEPFGRMTYNRIRDARTVVAIAGGVGITPFISMAKAIDEKSEDFSLVLIYGTRTQKDVVFKDDLQRIEKDNPDKFRVVHVYSEEKAEGAEYGFITSEIIKKYAPEGAPYSLFASGPDVMCSFLEEQIPALGLERKYIRIERTPDALCRNEDDVYKIKVHSRERVFEIEAPSCETVLASLEKSGFALRNMCRVGGCGFCRSKIVSGNYVATKYEKLRLADKDFQYFHPCCSYPLSDMEIVVSSENRILQEDQEPNRS